ncbi:MAG: hypothetical protein ACM3S1_02530 [Hyphomicrobiales bacterium]
MLVPGSSRVRAVIFDLDEVLLAREAAWCYAVEQAVLTVSGERVSAQPLAGEYRARPWRHVLSIVLPDSRQVPVCERLCAEMFGRSAMKKLLVHEGIGVGLDALRGAWTEMGAISREPHGLALKQVQSTGLDRFLAVLSPTPDGERWEPRERFAECLRFLDYEPAQCAFVSADGRDLGEVAALGAECYEAAWASCEPTGYPALITPDDLHAVIGTAR